MKDFKILKAHLNLNRILLLYKQYVKHDVKKTNFLSMNLTDKLSLIKNSILYSKKWVQRNTVLWEGIVVMRVECYLSRRGVISTNL